MKQDTMENCVQGAENESIEKNGKVEELKTRRDLFLSMGKWSKALVIGIVGATVGVKDAEARVDKPESRGWNQWWRSGWNQWWRH